ncbi:hypothetical protein [Haliscomenobacter hydrossis]|uniref:Pentapeptide repeat protein n=1 Tax=Haliscomenobacter hydrossis (strain ATCC 27775 / DSM 1100 / LMG 10767 / O) TaxID=760192 RepID=F4L0G3_HALH1|nr:hypothetical protein [Haliscomenobacter hydrossis]AEE48475.1 hypothetical protein Halhy_0566 [Haliscomenobacter hydrossis DSM 1100]
MENNKGKVFDDLRDINSGSLFQNMNFENCKFISCYFSYSSEMSKRSYAKNIVLKNCEQKNCVVYQGVLENITIENLKTHTLLQFWGTFFKKVIFKGQVGKIMISNYLSPMHNELAQSALCEANSMLFKETDWSIDISSAEFQELTIRGLPSKYILRNSELQIVVKRDLLENADLSMVDFRGTYYKTSIELFLDRDDEDMVLAAPMMHKKSSDYVNVLDDLVKLGYAIR